MPSVVSIMLVSIIFFLRTDDAMLVKAHWKLVCDIKSFLLIAIQGINTIILDIIQNTKSTSTSIVCVYRRPVVTKPIPLSHCAPYIAY